MPRILLVDDEDQIRITYAALLRTRGHEVTAAADGREAVELFGRQPFDLVITDVVMPRMGGAEAIAEMRRLRPDIKIIAAYGGGRVGEPGKPATVRLLGADLLLAKPFTLGELEAAVAEMLGRAHEP
jgi:CheY-like chemotaxis protein